MVAVGFHASRARANRERLRPFGSTMRLEATDIEPLSKRAHRPLTQGATGEMHGTMANAIGLLSSLIGWLRSTPEDLAIRRKMRHQLASLIDAEPNAVARHFALQALIGEFYRDRDSNPNARLAAINCCKAQIALAAQVATSMRRNFPGQLPRHVGFEQLAVILEKDKEYAAAIATCEEALRGGWNGDWEKRIERCRKRMAKLGGESA